jgi:hypothetical protein
LKKRASPLYFGYNFLYDISIGSWTGNIEFFSKGGGKVNRRKKAMKSM